MYGIESNRSKSKSLQAQKFFQNYHDTLYVIVKNDILPNLRAAHADDSLRSILETIDKHEDLTHIAARIAAHGDGIQIIIDELAHQACAAGTQWEEDKIDFCDVTDRVGRLQTIAHYLSVIHERSVRPTGRSILLMPCPGETHLFGLQLLGMAFRDAGWAVTWPEANSEWPGERLAQSSHDVVGLSLSNVSLLPVLREEIPRLRRASHNQSLRILVGGPCFDRGDAEFHSVGADAYAPDVCSAPAIADEIVNDQKLICVRSTIP